MLTIPFNMRTTIIFYALIIALFVGAGCTKSGNGSSLDNNNPEQVLTESLPNLRISEPLLLAFGDSGSNGSVDWKVTPSVGVTINKVGIYATFYFANAGNYQIVATNKANKQITYSLTVLSTNYQDTNLAFGLSASKVVGVKQQESIFFKITNTKSRNISWITSGNAVSVVLAADRLSASISFKDGFTGTVTVNDGINTQSRTIWLNDTASNTQKDTADFIFGDKLLLTPSLSTDQSGRKLLTIAASTNYPYQSTSDIILSQASFTNKAYTLSYGGVYMANEPQVVIAPATARNSFSSIGVGAYDFSVQVGNKTYSGSLSVTASGVYQFTWPATNGQVTIRPLTLQ